jgi:hypothetical protein
MTSVGTTFDGDKEMNLRYAGMCAVCGRPAPRGTRAIYNQHAKNVRHLECPAPVAPAELERGTAGGSAMREFERRQARDAARHEARVAESTASIQSLFGTGFLGKVAVFLAVDETPPRRHSTRAWETGAIGEERVAARLDALGEVGVISLHDRRIPGTRANIDHLVVTPWGVWIVDAKRYVGKKVDFDVVDSFLGFGGRKRLLVGGRDKTALVEGVEWQVAKVQEALGPDVEVRGCLCFVESEWPLLLADFAVRDIHVCWPKKLATTLLRREEPRLDPEPLARTLAARFPAAS